MFSKSFAKWGWPLFMAFIRLPLILLGNGVVILAFRLAGQPAGMTTGAIFSTLSVTAVNIICLGLLLWRAQVEGFQLSTIAGFQRSRLLRDLGWGVLWSMALFALLMAGMFVTFFVTQRMTGLSFAQIYMGDADFSIEIPQWLTILYAIIAAVLFPLLNAPIEELQYRGYVQPRLVAASGSVRLGIVVTAVAFGLQHIAFAYTFASMPAFVVGFFLWGLGAGIIAHRQRRLAPVIVAHFISNLSFGIVPLVFMLGGA